MKASLLFLFILMTTEMLAQKQSTFIYELTLFDQFKHRSMWGEKEHQIHQRHVDYLDSLEENGQLLMAGIVEQNMEGHTGFVVLNTNDYSKAREVIENDPSIKEGMMTARLKSMNIFFRAND